MTAFLRVERTRDVTLGVVAAVALFLHLMAGTALAQQVSPRGTPPNGKLEVAYRQLQDGKLSDSVHLLSLWCTDGQCSLTTVTVNQCMDTGDGAGFYPKVERTETREGALSVVETSAGSLVAEESLGVSTFRYQFTYSTRTDAEFSKSMRVRGPRWFDKLTGFSGGAVKHSTIAQRVLAWELAPVRARVGELALIEPKCKIAVFGIP